MEQQNQQDIQEQTKIKPQIKINWKLIVIIVVVSILALIVGIWSFTKPLLFVGFIFLSVFIIIFFALRTFLKLTTTRSIIVGVVLFILLFFFTLRILYLIKEKFFPPFVDDTPRSMQQQYKMNQSVDQENKTVDWKTYRNDEFGFEVRYPRNWVKESGHQEPNEFSFVDQRMVADIAVKYAQLYINTKKVSQEFIKAWPPGTGRVIGGMPTRELEDPHSKDGAYESKFYSFVYGENFYQIHTEIFNMSTVSESLRDPHKTHEFYRKIFDQILSTFRFVGE